MVEIGVGRDKAAGCGVVAPVVDVAVGAARVAHHLHAGVQIGDHAMIGTSAVVTRDVEPYHIVVGIPAKTAKVKTLSKLE